jgi:four helix bundle protein
LQELEESMYWIELLADAEVVQTDSLTPLMDEANELMAILVTCMKNVKARR